MGIARSTYYDKPAISIDDTALVETMTGKLSLLRWSEVRARVSAERPLGLLGGSRA